jgi:hypothetical protein
MLKNVLVAMVESVASTSKRKRFSKSLHSENDTPARAAAMRYWKALGYNVYENANNHIPDLTIETENARFYSEVEVKRIWKGEAFQYDTLQIPERKRKYTGLDLPCTFMVFNNEQTHVFLCESSTLIASPIVEVPNKFVPEGELFFQVPVNCVKLARVPVL